MSAALAAASAAEGYVFSLARALMPLTSALKPHLGDKWAYVPGYSVFFLEVWVLAVLAWRQLGGVPTKKAANLAAYAMSCTHGTLVALVSYGMLHRWVVAGLRADLPSTLSALRLDQPTTPAESLLTQLSMGYLIIDFAYMVAFTPQDVLFLVHHVVAGLYMAAVLHLGVGGITTAFTLFLGEVTSPIFNAFNVAKELRHESGLAARALATLSPIFTTAFVLTRSVAGPPLVAWFFYSLCFRSPGIPRPWALLLAALVLLGMLGSQLWSYKLLRGFARAARKRRQRAAKVD